MGGDMKMFESFAETLKALESRGSDKIMMDVTIATKRDLYVRLVALASRISPHLEK